MLRNLVSKALPVPPIAGRLNPPQVMLQLAFAHGAAFICLVRACNVATRLEWLKRLAFDGAVHAVSII